MIQTRFGTPVTIISRHHDYAETGWVDVMLPGGASKSVQVHDLRADGGAREIDEAARQAPERPTNLPV